MRSWSTKRDDPAHTEADAPADDRLVFDSFGTGSTGTGAVAVGAEARRFGRGGSLKTEWSRAFALMLVALLLGALATVVGLRVVTDQVQATAAQLHRESDAVAGLRSALDAHEQTGHELLSNAPVDRTAFLQQQQDISRRFDDAVRVLPSERDMRATASEALTEWQAGLAKHGLWGSGVQTLSGNRVAESPDLAASGAGVRALLDGIQSSALESLDSGLAYSAELQQIVIAARSALFGLAAVGVVYFRNRIVKFLIRPVEDLHRGVHKLQTGDYTHRIAVARYDELGELAEAFNSMAGAVHHSHLALTHRATHDPLTGLANRAALRERLSAVLNPGSNFGSRHECLLMIDVDDFKDVNDSLGHEGGDLLLVQLAVRLQGCVRASDLAARLGGDEFAIVVTDDADGSVTAGIAERIHDALRAPFSVGEVRLKVSVSMGAAQWHRGTGDSAELMRQADFAMYMAKQGGKGRYQLFDAEGYKKMTYHAALRADLATAVTRRELRLEYQPVADLRTGDILGVEALVRWNHPTLGLLLPAAFIPLAEETGDIEAIGRWVLRTATRQAAAWRASIGHCENLWVSVNLSTLQLPSPRNLAAIESILMDPASQADKVVLEVTETALASSVDGGITALHRLKSCGVRIAIDDFGTGYSSLSTLADLPADILKIDRSFLSASSSDGPSAAMLEGILGLAHKLNLEAVAEGIEDLGQLALLRDLGCRLGQGYFLSRPGPAPLIEALLASGARLQPPARAGSSDS
ncbi:putative bifunctional diguanylate cyclase/phosphodiesterase [Arthrobacter sp. PsM3]|uniref:putative bifunctional diguanylate cyclase/phosphodiesterase n=1 Tax=Arthrobacter sp. PsM3 TaxID=3030531 RepID=UPI00263B85AB|nr:bifunctional diguanylate cyclase/phosphodiesterase [Arthrobacter sp. PsM3]MDN4644380.1 EAL domain-containing protein [Arthrobacter sp. PsM3]